MTRINTISVKCLTDQHLLAEYLEYAYAVSSLSKSYKAKRFKQIPQKYTLGKGHVLFFLDKLNYLKTRHEIIKKELLNRGFKISGYSLNFKNLPNELFNNWEPSLNDVLTNFERIYSKIIIKPNWYKYYHKPLTKYFLDKDLYKDLVIKCYYIELKHESCEQIHC